MGKKGGKNKKGTVIVSTGEVDLGPSQHEKLLREQQQADFNKEDPFSTVAGAHIQPKKQEEEEDQVDDSLAGQFVPKPIALQNETEKKYTNLCRILDSQKDIKYDHNKFEMTSLQMIENNLIDCVFSNLMTLSEEQQNYGILAELELIHHI